MIKNRAIGTFRIPLRVINDYPSIVLDFMFGMIVLKADFVLEADCVQYTAISSKHFRSIPDGAVAPEYILNISGGYVNLTNDKIVIEGET